MPAPSPNSSNSYRIGVDENGLGSRLGPLLTSAVLAEVSDAGLPRLTRRARGQLGKDLDDSKRLLKHGSIALGEAWARAVVERLSPTPPTCPDDLVRCLALESPAALRAPCPKSVERQCWGVEHEVFVAPNALVVRVRKHLEKLERDGIRVIGAKSSIVCTQQLNVAKARGVNRFVRNLHAMEQLVLTLHEAALASSGDPKTEIAAVCGKVGGIADYSRFFGPLSGHLHAVLESKRSHSAYRFPQLGELHFVQDADAKHRLVMLASMLGKYLRELLMARITQFYMGQASPDAALQECSGYSDPVTGQFVLNTQALRQKLGVPSICFERVGASG